MYNMQKGHVLLFINKKTTASNPAVLLFDKTGFVSSAS